jgi:hypothetical protein
MFPYLYPPLPKESGAKHNHTLGSSFFSSFVSKGRGGDSGTHKMLLTLTNKLIFTVTLRLGVSSNQFVLVPSLSRLTTRFFLQLNSQSNSHAASARTHIKHRFQQFLLCGMYMLLRDGFGIVASSTAVVCHWRFFWLSFPVRPQVTTY